LPAQYAAFPHALTFAVLPYHILGEVPAGAVRENMFSKYPVGSGPFTLKRRQTIDGQQGYKIVQMAACDDYYKGKPTVSRFEIHAYTSRDATVTALRSGRVNAASGVPASSTADLSKAGYRVTNHTVHSGVYALLNVAQPILKDRAVRKALQIGTDTETLRDQL